jgi:hypothetical protein
MLMADMRDMSSAKATNMAAAETTADATDVTSAEVATDVTATKAAAHMTATKAAATHMAATATTTAACLCTGGEKAAGHNSGCQDLHYSSSHETLSHETLLCDGRGRRHRVWSGAGMSELGNYQRHDRPEVGMPARRLD